MMGRVLAWLMIITGSVILGFNGYKWWGEINVAVRDPKVAMTIADDWQETKEEPSLTSVDNLSTGDEQFDPGTFHEEAFLEEEQTKKTDTDDSNVDQEQEETNTTNNEPSTETNQQNNETTPTKSSMNHSSNHQSSSKKRTPNPRTTHFQTGANIGQLIIPKIGVYQPIFEGTDDKSLKKGIGKYQGWGTVAPNQTGHVVLSGHRNTVLPKNIGKLVSGDKLYVKFQNKVYTYQIRRTWITHADDRTVIVPINRPVLSLTTCFPFDYKGDAPDRYIIRADLIRIQNT